ncbi:signal peptidase I [Arthrobacter sp. H5]|uniref:signal peptidase I n=1 Tax=Arthrobacter sp. H5 TaxID=1267973 RepID=UPI000482BF4E|nr:signal peptidase I [Arthrobacter sp. H5]
MPVIAVALLMFLLALRIWILEPMVVESNSMTPTINPGTIVFILKPAQALSSISTGGLVVFDSPTDGLPMIKRVVGQAGQTIEIRDAQLYLDDVPALEPYVDRASIDGTYFPQTQVPPGTVFVMGDNRERSIDSRDFGLLPVEDITGFVLHAGQQ